MVIGNLKINFSFRQDAVRDLTDIGASDIPVQGSKSRFESCTIIVHDRTIFSQSCTIFVPRFS